MVSVVTASTLPGQTLSKFCIICGRSGKSGGQELLQEVGPRVELVAGDRDVQAVLLRQTVPLMFKLIISSCFADFFKTYLMNCAPGKIKQVSRAEHSVQNGLTHLPQ